MGATTAPCFAQQPPKHSHPISMPLRQRKRRYKDVPSPNQPAPNANPDEPIRLWQASRSTASPPGTRRAFNVKNALLAWQILHSTLSQILPVCWGDGMQDAITMSILHLVRGFMPASRAFSQALILDEVTFLHSSRLFPVSDHLLPQGPTFIGHAKRQLVAPRPSSCHRTASGAV